MAISINGNGTITGIVAGGLPDGSVVAADVATDAITNIKVKSDAAIVQSKLVDIVNADIDNAAAIAWSKLATDSLDATVTKVNLKDYGETTNAIGGTGGGTQDIDLTLGNSVTATVDTSANTFTFSNPTAGDEGCGFTLILTNGGSQTVTWPATVDWAGGTAPTLTTAGVDVLAFWTVDGGTIWYGFAGSLDNS
tara:strand:+ start:244 stop:825 length:582 start_codon:yes stop_codon:yes gene_type:complete